MWRIEVGFKAGVTDALGEQTKKAILEDLQIDVDSLKTISAYTINVNLTEKEIEIVARDLLTDPIIQEFSYDGTLAKNFSKLIEVGFKPGVTDNVGRTTLEGIEDLLQIKFKPNESVHTSILYLIKGEISDKDAQKICTGLLANPLIEYFHIWDPKTWRGEKPPPSYLPPQVGEDKGGGGGPAVGAVNVAEINLNVSDQELVGISQKGLLALELLEMQKIQAYYNDPKVQEDRKKVGLGPNPTDVELEMLAQTWSEHCKHKIFNGLIEYTADGERQTIDSLFQTYIKAATEQIARKKDWLVSVFVDNAGVISFNNEYNLVFKVETHNHPSALDPYGGAITGIVGVNRDPMGTGIGANLIFNTDVFCFGPPDYPYEKLPPGILHPKRILKGVRRGVEHGGNKIGIPTVNGAVLFDERYVCNPLVFCGTGGIMPKKIAGRESHKKKVEPGDLIVMVGGRIGKDGIHGATFSSAKLEETIPPTVVQIGAPIVQKKMMDALQEARDCGLYKAITDNGAGGLSSSVGEMAQASGGCKVQLEKAPTKYPGLDPWELWVSESQERMTLAVSPSKIDESLELCRSREVEATAIGEFTDSGKIQVMYQDKTVASLDLDFVHKGLPRIKRIARWKQPLRQEPDFEEPADLTPFLKRILSSLNVCSKEWVIRQYDHEVQGSSVVKPLVGVNNDGPSDAAVLRPLLDQPEGVVISNGINPKYSDIDTYWMAASAIDETIRNITAVGGSPERIALLDNFCWGNPILSPENPEGDYKLAQLVRAAQACYDMAVVFETPFISGKDSFHNEYQIGDKTISIPPTLLISGLGIIEDCEKAVTMDAKNPGDLIYILGMTADELGGSHYYLVQSQGPAAGQPRRGGAPSPPWDDTAVVSYFVGNSVPKVNPQEASKLYEALHRAISQGLVSSCHDCSEGGLAVAAAETAFAGGCGMEIGLRQVPTRTPTLPLPHKGGGDKGEGAHLTRNDEILFSESNSRFVVTVRPECKEKFEEVMKGNICGQIGFVREDKEFIVTGLKGAKVISTQIGDLKEAWQRPLRW